MAPGHDAGAGAARSRYAGSGDRVGRLQRRTELGAVLVGEEGEITTVDIDPEVVDRARRCLAAAGYRRVNVVLADAEGGVPGHAPYDRIIVTAEAWDIPPAWSGQLAEGGRLVVPSVCAA